MQQIVECVPNFSNGRDPDVYNTIADAIRSVHGVTVLDVSPDADHNRTVITFVGEPGAVEEGAFRAIKQAAALINLDEHRGEHPRIGATDVCPFIPVAGVSTEECASIARRLGERVGRDLGIAVYLYGDAATRPERVKLADIRKGQYELWKQEVGHNPDREPDFGPAEARPWGATVIGARPFLIAYNLYLNTNQVAVAEEIARQIRFIGGGLRYVQAKGFLVEGQAQVSMNLTDFERSPIYRVQEMVRREAARHGLSITKAELVGLTPQKALIDAAQWYLQLHDLRANQILEYRLQEEQGGQLAPTAFLQEAAAPTPTPGGGSSAALAGALAAALTEMVCGLTVGRKKYADVSAEAEGIAQKARYLRQELTAAIDRDAEAFNVLMAAYRNKDVDDEQRRQAIEAATVEAARIPLRVAELSLQAAELAALIARIGNSNAVTDAAAGALLAQAAVRVAALNVKINATGINDRALAEAYVADVEALAGQVDAVVAAAQATAAERGGF